MSKNALNIKSSSHCTTFFQRNHSRLIDEVFVGLREGVGGEGRGRLHHDLTQLLERRPPRFVREPSRGDLDHRDAETPDVGSDIVLRRIALRIDPFRLKQIKINI